MFEKKCTQEETRKSALKKRDFKKKPTQSKENDNRARRNVKVKGGATEEECVGQVVPRAQVKKSDKVHPLKVKEAMSSVGKPTIEDLQKDSTLKKCFDCVGNRSSERTMWESSLREMD